MVSKIKTIEELEAISKILHQKGKKIAVVNGCFDILHKGHIHLFEKAKSLADVLIVFVNGDDSIRKLKGEKRPLIPEKDRILILSSISYIDYICVFNEDKPLHYLEKIKPDFYVKGKEIKHETKLLMEKWGGKYIDIGDKTKESTSNIVETIIEKYCNQNK